MQHDPSCPFCNPPDSRIAGQNEHALCIRDAFPVSPGHSLLVPRRHIGSFFQATAAEREAIFTLMAQAKAAVHASLAPEAFNIGINDGAAAGQTVPHLHVHLIPRFAGDVPDPRGGVRWVIPHKADYWSAGA